MSFNPRHSKSHQRGGKSGFCQPGKRSKDGLSYQGKLEKIKDRKETDLKIKSHYNRELKRIQKNDEDFLKVPDFYQEIFSEVDREKNREKEKPSRRRGQQSDLKEQPENINQTESSCVEENIQTPNKIDSNVKLHSTPKGKNKLPEEDEEKNQKRSKPNPFKRTLEDLKAQDEELKMIREKATKEKEEALKTHRENRIKRRKESSLHKIRSKRGQPIMKLQLKNLLAKITPE